MQALLTVGLTAILILAAGGCCATGMGDDRARDDRAVAQRWPPPLDERLVVGAWLRTNAPIKGVPSHRLLQLKPDHTWVMAEIVGGPEAPDRVTDVVRGQLWEILPREPNADADVTRLHLRAWRDRPDGADSSREVALVTADQLLFGPTFNSISTAERYRKWRDPRGIESAIIEKSGDPAR